MKQQGVYVITLVSIITLILSLRGYLRRFADYLATSLGGTLATPLATRKNFDTIPKKKCGFPHGLLLKWLRFLICLLGPLTTPKLFILAYLQLAYAHLPGSFLTPHHRLPLGFSSNGASARLRGGALCRVAGFRAAAPWFVSSFLVAALGFNELLNVLELG